MKSKMLDITQIYGMAYDSFVEDCKFYDFPENSFDCMWEKLQAFDAETAVEIKLSVVIDDLLESNYEIYKIYNKSESEKEQVTYELKYKTVLFNLKSQLMLELERGNTELVYEKIMNLFKGMAPEYIINVLCLTGNERLFASFRELINIPDGEEAMSCISTLFESGDLRHIDKVSLNEFVSHPEILDTLLCSGKKRTLMETRISIIFSFQLYAYVDWLNHENESGYKNCLDIINSMSPDILSLQVRFKDLTLVGEYTRIKNLLDHFFENVLSKNIDEKAKTYILEFFSNERVSRDVQDRYEKYCKTHPDAIKIEFLPDKLLPIPLPKLEQWTESCLRCLYQKLIEGKFIAADTKEIDFLYVFGYCNEDCYDEVEPIIWIGDYKNKLGKKQIIDLLVLMGYDFVALKKKPLLDSLNGCFCATKSKQPGQETLFKSNNFSRGHESNMHKELECIVRETLSGV